MNKLAKPRISMVFKRIDQHYHLLDNQRFSISYDRLTTRLCISAEAQDSHTFTADALTAKQATSSEYQPIILATKRLLFSPITKINFSFNNQDYTLKINALMLWRSSLIHSETKAVIIKELLPKRRRRSVGIAMYIGLITAIKISLIWAH